MTEKKQRQRKSHAARIAEMDRLIAASEARTRALTEKRKGIIEAARAKAAAILAEIEG